MYFGGLNTNFSNWIENKIRYTYYVKLINIIGDDLFYVEEYPHFYRVNPLFNYDTCTSSNPKDYTSGNTLILQKEQNTLLTFKSNEETITCNEAKTIQVIENIKYTLYYTYNSVTGEPAPNQMTTAGKMTDDNGYYLNSEVIT